MKTTVCLFLFSILTACSFEPNQSRQEFIREGEKVRIIGEYKWTSDGEKKEEKINEDGFKRYMKEQEIRKTINQNTQPNF